MTLSTMLQIAMTAAGSALAIYCFVLSRRLRRLNNLESGLGGAIAVMTCEISRLEKAMVAAKAEATAASKGLVVEIERAKSERAYWTLQQKFAEPDPQARKVLRRRRAQETADA